MRGDSVDERTTDLAVMEAEEIKQKRRLIALLEAREKVEEQIDKAEELYVRGDIEEIARDKMILEAVQEFIREGWALLLEHAEDSDDDGRNYFAGVDLGEFEVADDTIAFNGLVDIAFADAVYVRQKSYTKQMPHGPTRERTEAVRRSVPKDISFQAYLTMIEFLSQEQGLELQFEPMDDSLPSFGYDTIDVDIEDMDIATVEEIEEQIDAAVDARALKDELRENGEEVANGSDD